MLVEDRQDTGAAQPSGVDEFTISERRFGSRLIVGTGKYSSNEVMIRAIRDYVGNVRVGT